MYYAHSPLNRNHSSYNLRQESAFQFPSSRELFQSSVNRLEEKVSNFIQHYLKACYNSNINAEEDLTRTTLQVSVT